MRRRNNETVIHALVALVYGHSALAFQAPQHTQLLARRNGLHGPAMLWQQKGSFRLGAAVGKTTPFKNNHATPRTSDLNPEEPHSEMLSGKSPKVIKLRKTLQDIWTSSKTCPIIVFGPRGSGKTAVVEELLDRLPSWQTENIHRLPMDQAINHIDTMLGSKSQPGLLDILSDQQNTTLVLTGFQSLSVGTADEFGRRQELMQTTTRLVTDQTFYSRFDGKDKLFAPRIIATCLNTPDFVAKRSSHAAGEGDAFFLVKVPPLESRTQDMEAIATAKINLFEKHYGIENVQISREATHRLLDHNWEEEVELDDELCKALDLLVAEKQQNPETPNVLKSKHMLMKNWNESMRHRLMYEYPILRTIIHSPWVFDHTLRYIVTPVFLLILAVLFLGPQTRDHNMALTIFWGGWWPAVMLSFPFLGRIWCSICPFMAVGTLAQEAATQQFGVKLKKWPKWVSTAGPPFAFGLFFAILMWEELWNLPQSGVLSAWLLLLITSGAVVSSVQFEKRMWCRHLCPIGAMCRTFGTMSILEVRSFKGNCQGCTDPKCIKGMSPAVSPSDTFAIKGCSMNIKNNQLRDTGHCTLCMSCIKNCEREVPELNARPIGLDYGLPWLIPPAFQNPKHIALSQVETNFWMGALLTVLQGSVLVHYMPKILSDFGIDPSIATATPALDIPFLAHSVVTALLLALPGLLSLAADELSIPLEYNFNLLQRRWGKADKDLVQWRIVVDTYEMIRKSNKPLQEIVREFDADGDGNITCWECQRAFGHLKVPEHYCETIMDLMKQRVGNFASISTESWLDNFQKIYVEATQALDVAAKTERKSRLLELGNALQTKKTFVEIFNDLDNDNDGFVSIPEVNSFLEKHKIHLTDQEKEEVFTKEGEKGRRGLNLFDFMRIMRKIVRVHIQEIGYGYLPLAWASLTAYWLNTGLKELGLSLSRLPDTFFMDHIEWLPHVSASDEVVQTLQAIFILGAIPPSIGLMQKLCDDNKIGGARFGLHVAILVAGAWGTLYLMLSSTPFVT